ncbi:DNA-directed RNA polymerase I subunit RPA49 [Lamellibrachia satsuma]|nr:DNA-directed RNA polymerase I subunit RPA49 [Lamellibrachia satsuma]
MTRPSHPLVWAKLVIGRIILDLLRGRCCHCVMAVGELNCKRAHHVRVGYHENTKRKKKDKILVAETARMQYVGYNSGPSALRASACSKYLVGKLNKKTGKMKVYDAEMFTLKPVLAVDNDAEDEVDASMTYMEQIDRLTSAFGTSRKKRAMSSRLNNTLTDEVLRSAVGSAVTEALARDHKLGIVPAKNQVSSALIPPCNKDATTSQGVYLLKDSILYHVHIPFHLISPYYKDATTSQGVYLLKDIISSEEMEVLKTPVKPWLTTANKDISLEGYPECVTSHLRMLPIDKKSRIHKACCLMYLHYMITLFNMKFKDIVRKEPFPETLEVPDIVKKKLLSMFTLTSCNAQGKCIRSRPARLKDKLLSYALVLCLILDEFHLEYTKLRKDFSMSQIRLNNHLRALGCHVSSQKTTAEDGSDDHKGIATLPVPVVFPELSVKRVKERR